MMSSQDQLITFSRADLADSQGQTWARFRANLKPRWWRVWFDIGAGYVVCAAVASTLALAERAAPRTWLPLGALGAIVMGYAVAYLQLFFHEAAHYLVAPTRRVNDLLANIFLGWMMGQDIAAYRVVHLDHHRHLGTPLDTERSYFDALNGRFLVEAFTGIKLVRVVIGRFRHLGGGPAPRPGHGSGRARRGLMLALGLAINALIVVGSLVNDIWSVATAWSIGVLFVHPGVNAVRQALEHRSHDARSTIDYAILSHGAYTRMFGVGPLASTFGGAGFNRHLLHHWEPQISYTCLEAVEKFLLDTPAAEAVRAAETTYVATFLSLLSRR